MRPSVPDTNRIIATKHHFSQTGFLNCIHHLLSQSQTKATKAVRPLHGFQGCSERQRIDHFLIYICQVMRGNRRMEHTDKLIKGRALLSHRIAHRGKVITISQFTTNLTVNFTERLPQFLDDTHLVCCCII